MTTTELAAQPVAYWTGVAYEAIVAFIRERQAALGYTQPQFWLLRNLSPHDISPDGRGMTVAELEQAMATYLRREDNLTEEAQPLIERGWLRRDDGNRLWITDAGEAALAELKTHTPAIRAQIHEGIDDADYATTVRVLQQMIHNVGGR
ncbi:winged helix-turn-helix transcriptional regulator [Actinoplanes sp. LDG1-06]|uniref:Winged helix-turn-helix transcriptional regulator n=1 Tax=Paractinoplanes ovalisporus TaxID=2810368 RepID=A0ABS2AJ76_9ACTN|nr:MarR family winged helix-turn-helix transcriptional regulator [Actinoplanes ovalisporus]MBM2619833.1 winged helix-turn-helix transcriptional regulator [Actinoplanes ovalisporus]